MSFENAPSIIPQTDSAGEDVKQGARHPSLPQNDNREQRQKRR